MAPEDQSTAELLADSGSPVHARVQAFWDGGRAAAWLAPQADLHIGRGSEAGLQIDHASVSRRHAVLHGGRPVCVEDLESANGVWVRGVRIPPRTAVPVFAGDVIALGSALVVVQPPAGASVPAPPPQGGAERPMDAVARLVAMVAPSDLSVLLLGETGAGKTTIAAMLHEQSLRASAPFVRLHCPSFPEALLESELFGHERGAFTGALQAKAGLIESADGGTVFLDEIGDLPLTTQAKLLNVVESREVLRLGSLKPHRVDVRFIAATNQDLPAEVARRAFRQDLYFRLDGISILVPPLRERRSEIAPLARRFVDQAAARAGRTSPVLPQATIAMLEGQPWPGNVRELRNVMERAVVLCPQPVWSREVLAPLLTEAHADGACEEAGVMSPADSTLRAELGEVERRRIEQALESCGGNQSKVAKLLGMSRRSLIRRMEAYGMPRPRKR